MKTIGIVGILALSIGTCAAQQSSQQKPVADETLTCPQLRTAIANAKAVEAKAAENKGSGVGGFIAGILIPGALGNTEMSNQFNANKAYANAKARLDKLTTLYRRKNCKG